MKLLIFALFIFVSPKLSAQGWTKSLKLDHYEEEMAELSRLGIDILGVDFENKIVDIHLHDDQLLNLPKQFFNKEIPSPLSWKGSNLSEYHDPGEAKEIFESLAQSYPDISELYVIGQSVEGRDILALKISDNPREEESDEPVVLFNAMHHAREVMTTEVILDAAEHLLTNYGKDFKVTEWVDDSEIWLVPNVNPDGGHKVHQGSNMWRKNTQGGYGVDLNRNYPFNWKSCNGSSGFRNSSTYRGPEPASEPETLALMNLVETIKPVFNISFHSYSEMVIYPYGCEPDVAEDDILLDVAEEMASGLIRDSGTGTYTYGTAWELLYNADGGDIDWMYGTHNVLAYVIEVSGRSQGFQPDYSWRDPTVVKMRDSWGLILDKVKESGIRGSLKDFDPQTTVLLESLGDKGKQFKPREINPDGSFHFVTKPGMYRLSYLNPKGALLESQEILVGGELVRL